MIRLCVRTNRRREALNLAVSLSDLKLVKDPQSWGMYKRYCTFSDDYRGLVQRLVSSYELLFFFLVFRASSKNSK